MKIQGFVKIVKRIGNVVTQVIEQENLIVRNYYEHLLGFNPNSFLIFERIFISSNTAVPDFNIGTGLLLPDMDVSTSTTHSWIDSIIPPFIQFQCQYPPPSVAVTFQTVGLYNTGGAIHAYLVLDTPCTQEDNEFLDIFYRLQFTNTSNTTFDSAVYDFAQTLIGVSSPGVVSTLENSRTNYYFGAIDSAFLNDYEFPYAPEANLINKHPGESGSGNYWDVTSAAVNSHFKFKMIADYDALTQQVGKIVKQILIGKNEQLQYAYYLDKTNNPQPIQSFFGHSSGATKPFFDSLTVASGNGVVNLAGTWTGGFPSLYKISIIASGATGTATYKIAKRKWLGFDGNSYTDLTVPCPYLNPNKAAVNSFHGWKDEDSDRLRFSDTQIVQYDQTGITLLDLLDGSFKVWDGTTTPSLPVTLLRQCAVVGDKIYAACRSTGLWIIDVTANTITHPITSPCYGTDVGLSNVVFAVLSTGIVDSADSFATSRALGITNKADVLYIRVDPEHVNNRIAVIWNNAGNCEVKWWQKSDVSTVDGPTNSIPPFPSGLNVSDSGSIWCHGSSILDFGSVSIITSGGYYFSFQGNVNTTLYGIINLYQVSFYKNLILGYTGLFDGTGALVVSYALVSGGSSFSSFSVHLVDGIMAMSRGMRQAFTDNTYCWINYGWNGSSWVEGNTSAKTTHTGVQAFLDGITIAFTNGATAPHWIATDYYTFAAADALVKDNATTLYIEHNWYSAPASYENISTTIPVGLVITVAEASDPEFITLEIDSPNIHEFLINGTPVALIRGDGSAPAPNEVTVYANGDIVFNAADSGKTFSGKYFYVKI